jgi:thiol-disulfide isomerase/thioredoxin
MIPKRVAGAALAVLVAACGQQHEPAQHATNSRSADSARAPHLEAARLAENARRLQLLFSQIQGMSGNSSGNVPGFDLQAPGGARYRSEELVGHKPFVAVFFATWCGYCEGELKAMQLAFQEVGPMPVIPVSVDGPETWEAVPGYLASFGIRAPAVRATDYRSFATTYNPADVLPSLAIVGRDGSLVDYLSGYDPAHAERMLSSMRHAKTVQQAPIEFRAEAPAWPRRL